MTPDEIRALFTKMIDEKLTSMGWPRHPVSGDGWSKLKPMITGEDIDRDLSLAGFVVQRMQSAKSQRAKREVDEWARRALDFAARNIVSGIAPETLFSSHLAASASAYAALESISALDDAICGVVDSLEGVSEAAKSLVDEIGDERRAADARASEWMSWVNGAFAIWRDK